MTSVHIHQIYYDEATRSGLDPDFIPLDNSANERPDWREYWPMRRFLLSHSLDPNACYGFLSPKFQLKTGLTGREVHDFIQGREADVYTFSPYVEQSAFFINVFEHGEANHPGFRAVFLKFLAALGLPTDAYGAICDLDTCVYSNFFIAKPAFWSTWLALGEALFGIAESREGELAAALNGAADYHTNVSTVGFKVFLMERLATLVLLLGEFKIAAYDPFKLKRTGIPVSYLDHEMRVANALKLAFIHTRDPLYMRAFNTCRSKGWRDLNADAG